MGHALILDPLARVFLVDYSAGEAKRSAWQKASRSRDREDPGLESRGAGSGEHGLSAASAPRDDALAARR
jgi:hypothetical protein